MTNLVDYGPYAALALSMLCQRRVDTLAGSAFALGCILSLSIYELIPSTQFNYYFAICVAIDYMVFLSCKAMSKTTFSINLMAACTTSVITNICGLVVVGLSWYAFAHKIIMLWVIITLLGTAGGDNLRILDNIAIKPLYSLKNALMFNWDFIKK